MATKKKQDVDVEIEDILDVELLEENEEDVIIDPAPMPISAPWEMGNTYSIRQDLYVWEDAGNNKKDYDEDDEIGTPDEFGKTLIGSGQRITVEDIQKVGDTYWIKTSFGWVCGKNSKLTYVN